MQTGFPILGEPVENVPMGAPKLKPRFTVDEYLAQERAALERHIYLDSEIFAMAGESNAHAIISANVIAELVMQLKGKPCQARTKDTKVRSGPIPETGRSRKGLFSYPDALVICGEPEFHDAHTDIILNPKVIIEILSESTEAFDRGEKFQRLQKHNPTLTDYILISQDKPQIEHFRRQRKSGWSYDSCEGLEASLEIASIGCTLKLADVYDRVVFAEG
jgi:Uma2 family endonuclease